jgi:hypothetical protein
LSQAATPVPSRGKVFRRPFDILLNQVRVDGDRRRRSVACRGNNLRAWLAERFRP